MNKIQKSEGLGERFEGGTSEQKYRKSTPYTLFPFQTVGQSNRTFVRQRFLLRSSRLLGVKRRILRAIARVYSAYFPLHGTCYLNVLTGTLLGSRSSYIICEPSNFRPVGWVRFFVFQPKLFGRLSLWLQSIWNDSFCNNCRVKQSRLLSELTIWIGRFQLS